MVVKREGGQKMTNFFIVNISMRKMLLEVEFLKSMIYEILKIFRRIKFHPKMILRHFSFKKNTGLLIFNSLKQKKLIFNFFVNRN